MEGRYIEGTSASLSVFHFHSEVCLLGWDSSGDRLAVALFVVGLLCSGRPFHPILFFLLPAGPAPEAGV